MTISSASSASYASLAAKTGVRHTTAILAIILVSYFMILLDNSMIFTALPKIHAAMRFSPAGLAWVQDAYTLVFGGLLLLSARAGDLLGRRRVFVFGLTVFALASLLVGLAPAGWWLIAARGVQGIGAAIVAPSSLSILTASFTERRERAKAVALSGATAGIGASLQREEEREMFGLLADQGVGSIPWSPLAKGRLARPWGEKTARSDTDDVARWVLPNDDKPIADAVQKVAGQHGVPMAQIALAWVLRNPVVSAPIVGATRQQHLTDAAAALDVTLSDDEVRALEEHYTPRQPTGY